MSSQNEKSAWIDSLIELSKISISVLISFLISWLLEHWQDEIIIKTTTTSNLFIKNHPYILRTIIAVITYIFFVAAIRGVRHIKRGNISIASGIFYYCLNTKKRHLKKSEKFLKEKSKGCNTITIFGASGWETFGGPNSPLNEALKTCQEVRILLVHPLSNGVTKRAIDLGMTIDTYRSEIYQSINFLKWLRLQGCHIELKMYESYPLWKLILLEHYTWIQQYPPDEHVKNSPCYAFERIPTNMRSIHNHLYRQCLGYWDSTSLGTFNFTTDLLEFRDASGNVIRTEKIY